MTAPSPDSKVASAQDAGDHPRVGIFQANWPLQIHTVNSAVVLADSGFKVDLFLYGVSDNLVEGMLDKAEGIRVIRLDREKSPSTGWVPAASGLPRHEMVRRLFYRTALLRSIWERCRSLYYKVYVRFYPAWLDRGRWPPPRRIVRETLSVMRGLQYKVLIGMEKAGLSWAGQVGDRLHVPCMYHSLELYTRDYYGPEISLRRRCLQYAEQKYHRKSYATIVQDEARGRVLCDDNQVKPSRMLYVPVSILGRPRVGRSKYLHRRLGIAEGRVVVLQFGNMNGQRFGVDLVERAQRFPEKWTLVMHGPPPAPEQLLKIRAADVKRRVVLSLDRVPSSQLDEMLSSADVGLVLYGASNWNDRLTAFSSEKMARYLHCGIPVVAFNYPGYEILEDRRCGAVIESLDELTDAVERIMGTWSEFSRNAQALFVDRYEFRANYAKVVKAVRDLP